MSHPNKGDIARPAILIDCGLHAREWVSVEFCIYVIQQLLSDKSVEVLEQFDFHIIPVVIPDGYAYSHKTDRLWRKNRQSTGSTACVGVDVNRSFGFGEIGTVGSFVDWMASNNTCDEIYHGPNSFSSSEAKGIQSAIHHIQRNQKLAAYLTVHSYGQVITTDGFLCKNNTLLSFVEFLGTVHYPTKINTNLPAPYLLI